jgi:hypothetical protein
MPTTSADGPTPFLQSLLRLQKIRNFEGTPAEFWRLFLETLIGIARARAGLVCLRTGEGAAEWKTLAALPEQAEAAPLCKRLSDAVPAASAECAKNGFAFLPQGDSSIAAINLLVDVDTQKCFALFYLDTADKNEAVQRIRAVLAANDIPAQYRVQQTAYSAIKNQTHITDILDLLTLLNAQHRFVAAAMTLCNELAARYTCDRVSLGWLQKGYVRVKAMSHTDHFEKKMEALSLLELAMEEALDQEADVIVPPSGPAGACITRDHEAYAKAQDVRHMATLPLRAKDAIVALVSFEKEHSPLGDDELRHLRVTLDQIATRLVDLKRRDRWFGARLAEWLRDKAARLVGYEHTWAKTFALLGVLALAVVTIIPVRYRIDSPMILRTDDVVYITAPFDGYIDSVGVKPGDAVAAAATLLTIDKKDLLLEEASLLAEKNREQREVEKARAAGELADMCIAQARFDQVTSKLDITRYRLGQAALTAPYDGVVTEGDQREKIGSPVKQGEILFKIGRITKVYAEAKVSEMEIHNVKNGAAGQIALASRPADPFDVAVSLIEPSAVVTAKDNVFLVRCTFVKPVPAWFRPGMTGVSKINAGRKTLLWIAAHRTVDFLRLKLWW